MDLYADYKSTCFLLQFGAAGLLLRPSGGVTFGQVETTCDQGMEKRNGTCSELLIFIYFDKSFGHFLVYFLLGSISKLSFKCIFKDKSYSKCYFE